MTDIVGGGCKICALDLAFRGWGNLYQPPGGEDDVINIAGCWVGSNALLNIFIYASVFNEIHFHVAAFPT